MPRSKLDRRATLWGRLSGVSPSSSEVRGRIESLNVPPSGFLTTRGCSLPSSAAWEKDRDIESSGSACLEFWRRRLELELRRREDRYRLLEEDFLWFVTSRGGIFRSAGMTTTSGIRLYSSDFDCIVETLRLLVGFPFSLYFVTWTWTGEGLQFKTVCRELLENFWICKLVFGSFEVTPSSEFFLRLLTPG